MSKSKQKSKQPKNTMGVQEVEEDSFEHDEDYLFTRKADKYMFVILDPNSGTWRLIQETEEGPKSGYHWGEIRLNRELMFLVAFKLMTLEPVDPKKGNPFSDQLLDQISTDITHLFDDIVMMAADLK